MTGNTEDRRLERKAKSMMLNKDIPASKMDLVRSLLKNEELLNIEKYSAIIDLIKNCPDKVRVIPKSPQKVSVKKSHKAEVEGIDEKSSAIKYLEPAYPGVTHSSIYINDIFNKYREIKLFKKKYLIRSNNFFKFSLKKRLIPSKKLFKILKTFNGYQEKILYRLPVIMNLILDDPKIEDPVIFNYLRIIQKWLMDMPLSAYDYDSAKWLDENHFEVEFKNYISYFFSFNELEVSTKEKIIELVEKKLRAMEDLAKEPINPDEGELQKTLKEKVNLKKEKIIYDYLITFRSFISALQSKDPISVYLKKICLLDSYAEFLRIILEALVFRHQLSFSELLGYYKIKAPEIKKESWDYTLEYLKSIGKDPESRREQYIENLKKKIVPYEDIILFISLKFEGQNVLSRAFEEQWKILKKRRQPHDKIYNENFFIFVDECVNYFSNVFLPFLDGSELALIDTALTNYESAVFSPEFFEREKSLLEDLQCDIHYYHSNNPNIIITRSEMHKIKNGQIQSMREIASLIKRTGALFYSIGRKLLYVYRSHQLWIYNGRLDFAENIIRTPLKLPAGDFPENIEGDGFPVPFYDCRIEQLPRVNQLNLLFIGKNIMNDSLRNGIFKNVVAFCFQLSYECFDDMLFDDLKNRKELRKKIKDLSGKKET